MTLESTTPKREASRQVTQCVTGSPKFGRDIGETMKILVTVKRVTDYERKVKITPDGTAFETDGMNFVPNPFDEIAVEEALRLTKEHGGEVVVVSIGSNDATQQIRQALAMGAQRGVLVQAGELDSDGVAKPVSS